MSKVTDRVCKVFLHLSPEVSSNPQQVKISLKGEPIFLWWAHLYSEILSPKYRETEISICLLVEPVGALATQEFSKSLLRKTPLLWRFL